MRTWTGTGVESPGRTQDGNGDGSGDEDGNGNKDRTGEGGRETGSA